MEQQRLIYGCINTGGAGVRKPVMRKMMRLITDDSQQKVREKLTHLWHHYGGRLEPYVIFFFRFSYSQKSEFSLSLTNSNTFFHLFLLPGYLRKPVLMERWAFTLTLTLHHYSSIHPLLTAHYFQPVKILHLPKHNRNRNYINSAWKECDQKRSKVVGLGWVTAHSDWLIWSPPSAHCLSGEERLRGPHGPGGACRWDPVLQKSIVIVRSVMCGRDHEDHLWGQVWVNMKWKIWVLIFIAEFSSKSVSHLDSWH